MELFPLVGGKPNRSAFKWTFPIGATCRFRHLSEEKDLLNVQGAEICYIGLDELTHFPWEAVNTLFAANRSLCGVDPFMRATCNPDASSWVAEFIEPWIGNDGYPDLSLSGKIRTFDVDDGSFIWRSPTAGEELLTATFVPALIHDNPKLVEKDPRYVQRLRSMSLVERERFLMGNWRIKAETGTVFKRGWFECVNAPEIEQGDRLIRYWDLAATTQQNIKHGDFTVGLLMQHKPAQDIYYVRDVIRRRLPPAHTNELIVNTAAMDGVNVAIRWQQEGGAAGIRDSVNIQNMLRGYDAYAESELRDKVSRALPCSYLAEQGKIKLAIAPWNRDFLIEIEQFPDKCRNDDQVDGLSGAYNSLAIAPPKRSRLKF